MKRPPDLPTLRALWWATRALRRVHGDLRSSALTDVRVSLPPALPAHAFRGVRYALRKSPSTCLEQALLRQAWHTAHGEPREVVIGVTRSTSEFAAHAWLDPDPGQPSPQQFEELLRLPAP